MDLIRVLCVENRQEHLNAMTYLLEAAGYEVVQATSGAEGLERFTREDVEGVLVEYDLPDATGTAIRADMKRLRPEIPVLLFAGIGCQTPFLLRFFDSYLRTRRPEWAVSDLDA